MKVVRMFEFKLSLIYLIDFFFVFGSLDVCLQQYTGPRQKGGGGPPYEVVELSSDSEGDPPKQPQQQYRFQNEAEADEEEEESEESSAESGSDANVRSFHDFKNQVMMMMMMMMIFFGKFEVLNLFGLFSRPHFTFVCLTNSS
jgi:hypothetical protein